MEERNIKFVNAGMMLAIEQAKRCKIDVPVGCVIYYDNKIIASAYNQQEELKDVTCHAEILAIKQAEKKLDTKRLRDCTMFVTLEPCPMCSWAILQAGIDSLYFGSYNKQYGGIESVLKLPKLANSKIKIYGGIEENNCDILLKDFFKKIR